MVLRLYTSTYFTGGIVAVYEWRSSGSLKQKSSIFMFLLEGTNAAVFGWELFPVSSTKPSPVLNSTVLQSDSLFNMCCTSCQGPAVPEHDVSPEQSLHVFSVLFWKHLSLF